MSFVAALHLMQAAHFWFACYYDWNYVNVPVEVYSVGLTLATGKLKFLTFWNALLQAAFFTICLLNNFIGTSEINPKSKPFIRRIRDTVLATLALPLSLFVGLSFWSIYAIDRELIFPKALDPFFPVWLNHAMHTNIMIFVLIQTYMSYHEYPSRKVGVSLFMAFMAIYLVWIHIIHAQSGVWVYPILEVLNFPLRLVFFGVAVCVGIFLYILGEKLNKMLWRNIVEKNKRKKRN
ncbi:androgen-induced gene 1 protein-like isoform X1 [Photinus pyralis]|uniref:Androgen-dependent TFPI-regulating protein n=1 Tax=Photinus pyralis TaxID=7054 RepID=A0A1Y1LPI5_PHOPY|nr:androgen-induced gene 1 protein-like isoform X1 [Photinus pyralis]